MSKPYREVTDEEWQRVSALVPELRPPEETWGRRGIDARVVLNGALWVLMNDQPWAALPSYFPPYQTCHRRWKAWLDSGVFEPMLRMLFGAAADDLKASVRVKIVRRNVDPVVWRRCIGGFGAQ